jgi:hypothetical protein
MVMLSAASALVAGSVAGEQSMANQQIQVVRPFWFGGKAHQAGTVIEVPAAAAAELLAMGKAKKCDPPLPKPAPAPKVEAKAETKEQSK